MDYGYGDAKPDMDYGYGDAQPDNLDYGYRNASPPAQEQPVKQRKPRRRCSVTKFSLEEAAKNEGCTVKGMCGKSEETANLQDLLIYALRGVAVYAEKAKELGISDSQNGLFVGQALFNTITNANFDNDRIINLIGYFRHSRIIDQRADGNARFCPVPRFHFAHTG